MIPLHPLLEKGAILHIGPSPADETNQLFLTYEPGKTSPCICPEDFIPIAKLLGLELELHWMPSLAQKGVMAVSHSVRATKVLLAKRDLIVEPFIQVITEGGSGGLQNKNVLHLLKKN